MEWSTVSLLISKELFNKRHYLQSQPDVHKPDAILRSRKMLLFIIIVVKIDEIQFYYPEFSFPF